MSTLRESETLLKVGIFQHLKEVLMALSDLFLAAIQELQECNLPNL